MAIYFLGQIVMYLGKHLGEVLGGRVVTPLLEVGLHLVLDLGLVQVPGVLLLSILARRGVGGPGNLKKTSDEQRQNRGLLKQT